MEIQYLFIYLGLGR